ncbi:MAG: formyltransferase family protein [Candidatus Omnitrophota bacterium]
MKIVYIGTVEFSKAALQKLIELKADVVGVLTRKSSGLNADFADLSSICVKNKIPYKYVTDINIKENQEWIRNKRPDIIFCFGFSQIIKKAILKIPSLGIVGYHPAKLPINRGRHPLIWALALGLGKTASTFFFMDESCDSGDILSQRNILIEYSDDAGSLYRKVTNIALRQMEGFLPKLQKNNYSRIPQDHSKSSCWRKRIKEDGRIDFRMTSRAIYNLVRALTKPYPGAHLIWRGEEVKIWQVVEKKYNIANIECGKVLGISGRQVLVKCYAGAILLTVHEFKVLPQTGEYLL